ncbi:MAG: response regulator [Candidatus Omnitrophica bacterium]|nr:response regulator [Candidatus Omnitrophota bacterium]
MGKVLVIDDLKAICDILCKLLINEGYDVLSVNRGEDAIRTVKEDEIGLIFLDVILPGMDGIEVLEEIRRIDGDVAVVMMTAYPQAETFNSSRVLGAVDYITKPFSLERIKEIVGQASSLSSLDRRGEWAIQQM